MLSTMLSTLLVGVLLSAYLATASPTPHQKRTINNNVLDGQDFPDPCVISSGGTTYVFGTTTAGLNIPYTSSSNFEDGGSWDQTLRDAFPSGGVPAFSNWAQAGTTWAPDVSQLSDGSYALYYSAALNSNPAVHCTGLARSGSLTGPYNDSSTAPLFCPESQGGAIDASGFLDPQTNNRYVVYKVDGPAANNGGYCASTSNTNVQTPLILQQTQSDGYTQIGSGITLYNNAGVSDSYNIEAPVIQYSSGTYFLFFSSGCYSDNSYAISYVTASNVAGPYGNRQSFLQTGDQGLYGPGGESFEASTGYAVYHSLIDDNSVSNGRQLNTANFALSGQSASLN